MHDRLNCLCFFCIVLFFVFEKTNVTEVSPPNGRGSVQQQISKNRAEEYNFNGLILLNNSKIAKRQNIKSPAFTKLLSVVQNSNLSSCGIQQDLF